MGLILCPSYTAEINDELDILQAILGVIAKRYDGALVMLTKIRRLRSDPQRLNHIINFVSMPMTYDSSPMTQSEVSRYEHTIASDARAVLSFPESHFSRLGLLATETSAWPVPETPAWTGSIREAAMEPLADWPMLFLDDQEWSRIINSI